MSTEEENRELIKELLVQAVAMSHIHDPQADSLVKGAVAQAKLIWDKEAVRSRLFSIISELPLASQETIIQIKERLEGAAFDAQLNAFDAQSDASRTE